MQKLRTREESEITEIVNRETRAWDTRDADLLISIFHPDMVWPWPRTTLSIDKENNENRWKGRVCKVYSRIGDEWKMTMHTGVLLYEM